MTDLNNQFNDILSKFQREFKYLENFQYYDCCYKQAVFRYFYNIYLEKAKYNTLYQYVCNDLGESVDNYRTYLRNYQKLEKNQLKSWKSNDLEGKIAAPSLKKDNRFVIYEYQKLQLEIKAILDDIFYKNAENKIAKTKNFTNKDYIYNLQRYDEAYNMIERDCKNSFLKCLQYYQLEIKYRFESFYKFFSAIKKSAITVNKTQQYENFTHQLQNLLMTQNHNGGVLQNTLMTDIDLMIEEFNQNPEQLDKILLRNRQRNILVLNTLKQTNIELPKETNIEELVSCEDAENFFENYIGNGQHIIKNKNFEKDIDIKYFRKIYSNI